jgi:hypothetical protein
VPFCPGTCVVLWLYVRQSELAVGIGVGVGGGVGVGVALWLGRDKICAVFGVGEEPLRTSEELLRLVDEKVRAFDPHAATKIIKERTNKLTEIFLTDTK